MGDQLFQRAQALGKSGQCSRQLAGECCKAVPQSTGQLQWGPTVWSYENVQNPAMKVLLQIKEDLCWKVTGSELCQQGLFNVESPIKCPLPMGICMHIINSCVRCIGGLYICFTYEGCDLSSINKISTRVVATCKRKESPRGKINTASQNKQNENW